MAFDGTLKFDTAIDKTGFKLGLDSIGSIAKMGLGAVTALVGAATAGVAALGTKAIESGKSFEAGMSQIQATLGFSIADVANNINGAADTMEKLSQKAEEMGRATAFSATQAAEGLNTIAMAGYGAEDAVLMIENGLNLASAGHLQLDQAMKYVTGSMKGFTKEAEKLGDAEAQSAYYADIIAKGATMAATDVNQLGEAFSGVAATANGYNQTAQATEVALLRLAEQGITGSEAATHLSQLMKDLYTPTDQAKEAFEKLGVSVYDETTGMQKDVNTVVDEINAKLDEIRTASPEGIAEAADLENIIFGQRGQKAFDKMIVSSAEKVQSFYDGLEYNENGAKGSATLQAEAMLDNLEGDMTLLQSAAEGLYNSLYKSMNGTLRELAQLANGYVTELTEAFTEGGFEGLAQKAGDILGDAITKISGYLPKIVKIGTSLVSSLLKGLSKNSGNIAKTGIQIALELIKGIGHILAEIPDFSSDLVQALADGISQNYSQIRVTAKVILNLLANSLANNIEPLVNAGMHIVGDIAKFIVDNLPLLLDAGMRILEALAQAITDNLDALIEAGLQLIQFLCDALLDGENLGKLLDAGIRIISSLVNGLLENLPEIRSAIAEIIGKIGNYFKDHYKEIISYGAELVKKIANGLKNTAVVLLGETVLLIEDVGEKFKNYGWLTIGADIVKKIADGIKNMYDHAVAYTTDLIEKIANAIKDTDWIQLGKSICDGILSGLVGFDADFYDYLDYFKEDFLGGFFKKFEIHSPSKVMRDEVGKYLALGIGEGFADNMKTATEQATKALETMTADFPKYGEQSAKQFLDNLSGNLKQVPSKVSEILNSALDFAEKWGISISQNGKNSAKQFLDNINLFMEQLPDLVTNICDDALKNITDWGISLYENGKILSQKFVDIVIDTADTLPEKMLDIGHNLVQGLWEGITNAGDWLKNQIGNFANNIVENFKDAFGIQSPSKVMRDAVGKYLAEGVGVGFTEKIPDIERDAVKAFSNLQLPEIPVGFDEISEIPKMEMESPKIPEIPDVPLNIGDIPKMQVNVSEIPDISDIFVSIADIPEMPEIGLNIPEISNISVNIDDVPELPELGLQLPDVPEMNINAPELDIPDIPDISVDIGDIPQLPELKISGISDKIQKIDEVALQAFRSQIVTPVNIVRSSPTSQVVNNYYQQTTNNTTTNNGKNSQQGDIIIPIYLEGTQIQSAVISAIQVENMRSGGGFI